MKKTLKILISIILISYLIHIFDFSQLSYLDYKITYVFCISILIWIVAFYFMSLRWLKLIQINNYNIELNKLYGIYWIGSFFNIYFPGGIGGDTVRVKYFNDIAKIGLKKSTAIILKERIFGLIGLFAVLILGLSYSFDEVIQSTISIDSIGFITFGGFIITGAFFFFFTKKYKVSIKQFIYLTSLSIMGQFADIIIVYMFVNYFEVSINFTNLLFVMPLVYFATVLPISFGGVGVREGVFVFLMTIFGVDSSMAILISFLLYFSKILIGLIGMAIYLQYKKGYK